MEKLNELVGENLKNIRKERGLSLDKVSELTGVSKSMLGQIERGETSPTINTIWKIANGLKVSFTSLLRENKAEVSIKSIKNIEPMVEVDGKFRLYPIFPFDGSKRFEIYLVEIYPNCTLEAQGHLNDVEEYIIVNEGELKLSIDGETYTIPEGSSINFLANKPHSYTNNNNKVKTKATMLLYYP